MKISPPCLAPAEAAAGEHAGYRPGEGLPDYTLERRADTVLAAHRARFGRQAPVWVFGYASLIWRPEFEAEEHQPALVKGWHRCLRMHSRVNRGTPENPGLVFALMRGGACRGMVYRLPRRDLQAQFARLWAREMPLGVYDPRWVSAHTPSGSVPALAFTLSRHSPAWTGPIPDSRMLEILRNAKGRFGSTLDYLLMTHQALSAHGVPDQEIARLVRLARLHGLCADTGAGAPPGISEKRG